MNVLLEAVGWTGSALLVMSLLQSNITRLRWLNLSASIILVGYNAAITVWPMVAVNAAIAVINVVYLVRLARAGRQEPGTGDRREVERSRSTGGQFR